MNYIRAEIERAKDQLRTEYDQDIAELRYELNELRAQIRLLHRPGYETNEGRFRATQPAQETDEAPAPRRGKQRQAAKK